MPSVSVMVSIASVGLGLVGPPVLVVVRIVLGRVFPLLREGVCV